MQQTNAISDAGLDRPPRGGRLKIPPAAWLGFGMAVLLQGICHAIVGVNAGLFFGGIIFVVLLISPLTLIENRFGRRALISIAIVDGIAAVWLVAVFVSDLTLGQWLRCDLLLISWGIAIFGTVCATGRLMRGAPREIPSAITVLLLLAWVTLPVWLARFMPAHPQVVHKLISVHPLFALNSVVRDFGLWTERPIAYRYLLTLGQDLPTGLPGSIIPAIIFHSGLGALGLIICRSGKTSTDGAEVG